jgi:hypothetical protein
LGVLHLTQGRITGIVFAQDDADLRATPGLEP